MKLSEADEFSPNTNVRIQNGSISFLPFFLAAWNEIAYTSCKRSWSEMVIEIGGRHED